MKELKESSPVKAYTCRATGEVTQFRKTPFHTYVRVSDDKVFTIKYLDRSYEEVPEAPKTYADNFMGAIAKVCSRCGELRAASNFYNSSSSQVCRFCVSVAYKKRVEQNRLARAS